MHFFCKRKMIYVFFFFFYKNMFAKCYKDQMLNVEWILWLTKMYIKIVVVGWCMVLNGTFNNISVISCTLRKPLTCRKSLTNFITQCCIQYISPWTGFELTLVVIGTDCTGSCKSNNGTIRTQPQQWPI
jgi:hypothetical protein